MKIILIFIKSILRIIILLTLLINITSATTKVNINSFKKIGTYYNITPSILYILAKIESGLNQYAIGTMPTRKQRPALIANLKYRHLNYRVLSKYHISIYPKTKYQVKVALYIINALKINFDAGLMQINRYNIKHMHLHLYRLFFDKSYNIFTGAYILNKCIDKFSPNVPNIFECYNIGYNVRKFNYAYSNFFILKYKAYYKSLKDTPSHKTQN